MNWFFIALITPIAHAAVNHLDKHLLSKYFKGGHVGSLVLFSALFAAVALPVIYFMDPGVLSVKTSDVLLLIFNGFLLVLAYICYFYALNKDEASFVAPLFQLIPVFGFILGYFFLGETLTRQEIIGALVIIFGAVILSLELTGGSIKVKKVVILLMIASSLLYAINAVLFKFVAVEQQGFLPALFWDFSGKVVIGLLILATIKSYREQFFAVLKQNSTAILSLNILNEVLALVGEAALVFAVLLAPVVLVQVVSGFQPLFVFIFGILLTILAPSFGKELLTRQAIFQKIAGIVLIVIGTYLIN